MNTIRCEWSVKNELEKLYHDSEWGVPLHDDQLLFEFLILEGAQAGLSWSTILKKRETYRLAYNNFDPHIVATYDHNKIESLLQDPGIIRNKLKVKASITNAISFLKIIEEFGSFNAYIWGFVHHKPIVNYWKDKNEVPSETLLSAKISKDLKKRGFKFVGSTICYAFMQAIGMVNDHTTDCFRHQEVLV